MNMQLERACACAARLKLADVDDSIAAFCDKASDQGWTHARFCAEYFSYLCQAADARSAATMLRMAAFPYQKSIEEFDFAYQKSVSKRVISELAEGSYLGRKENLIFLGPPGTGKTHLAISLGMVAAQSRLRVKFTTGSAMVAKLKESRERNSYSRRLSNYIRPSLLIIDEVGFSPLSREESSLLFEVICARYEQGSIILTSNKGYSQWAEIFSGDDVLATAMLDRLLHHSQTFVLRGESYRMKEHKEVKAAK